MIDSFYIGAYWSARAESLDNAANKSLEILLRITVIDEQFKTFYEKAISRKKALEKTVSLDYEVIKSLYLKGTKKNEIDSLGYAKMGFMLRLWTGQSDGESSGISFSIGTNSTRFKNSCVITFPYEGSRKDDLLQLNKAKLIIGLLCEICDPDYAVLNSDKLSSELCTMNEIGWITYKKQLTKKPKVSHNIIHESNYKGGHLFYLETDSGLAYDYDRIEDLKALKDSF